MRALAFEVELLDPVVASASGATAGGHRSLGFLPGAMFLGAAARRLYRDLGTDAWTVFHSGRVRFLPALPLAPDGSTALPLPRSYHVEKYGDLAIGERLPESETKDLQNLARPGKIPMGRPEAIEAPYFSASGHLVKPAKRRIAKTAIDPSTRRRQESQFFEYECLEAGGRFRATVQLDDDVPEALDARIASALCDTTLQLGRSKKKEFGRARTTSCGVEDWTRNRPQGDQLALFFLSDVALVDPATGQPTLEPQGEHFGLAGARVLWEHTYLRARRYSPINGKRLRPDLEHHILVHGSVVVFELSEPVAEEDLARLGAGAGAYRAEGLGQVLIEPSFLSSRLPHFPAKAPQPARAAGRAPHEWRHELRDWAEEGAARRAGRESAYELAMVWLQEIQRIKGPGRAQWGMVRERAALAASGEALVADLFGGPPQAPGGPPGGLLRLGVRAEAWKQLVERFAQRVEQCPPELRREAVQLLAARMQQALQVEGRQ